MKLGGGISSEASPLASAFFDNFPEQESSDQAQTTSDSDPSLLQKSIITIKSKITTSADSTPIKLYWKVDKDWLFICKEENMALSGLQETTDALAGWNTDANRKKVTVVQVISKSSEELICPTTCANWFKGFDKVEYFYTLQRMSGGGAGNGFTPSRIDLSNCTDCTSMFEGCSSMKSTVHLEGLSSCATLDRCFYGCTSIGAAILGSAKASVVTSAVSMFENCTALQTVTIDNFEVPNGANVTSMFKGANGLKTISCSAGTNWSSKVTGTDIFSGCTNLEGGNGTKFDASKTGASYARMDDEGTPGYFTLNQYKIEYDASYGQPTGKTVQGMPDPAEDKKTNGIPYTLSSSKPYVVMSSGNAAVTLVNDRTSPESKQLPTTWEIRRTSKGWTGYSSEGTIEGEDFGPGDTYSVEEGLYLYAQWPEVDDAVSYTPVTLPKPDEVKGYEFTGWLPEGEEEPVAAGESYTPKSDSDTLTAQWEPKKYKVTCVDVFTGSSKATSGTAGADYLELGRDESKSFDYDSSVDGAKFAEKAYSGYVYDSCSDAVTVDDSDTQVVYRYYKAKTTIAVEGPGSASGADVATYTASYAGEATDKGVWKGEKVEISNIAMAQDYYELDEVAATEGEVTEAGGTYTYEVPAGGQTVTVKAKHKTYKVTYSLNYEGAPDASPAEQSVTYGAKWSVTADPSRADYKFTGWYDNEGCTGDPVTGEDSWSRTSNLPLYAGWEKSALTVSYWIGGSKVGTQAGKVGEPVAVKDASAMEGAPGAGKGWKFKGWAAKADASKPLYGGTTGNATVTTSADFDLYAVFEREVAVSYCKAASDLAVTTEKQTQTLGTKLEGDEASESLSTVSLPALPASDYGWKPLGWLGCKTVPALATITAADYALPAGADGALPALYERSVTLEYDGNGGGEPFSSDHTQSVQAGQPADKLTITLAKSRFAKEGQTFAGWSADRSAASGSVAGAGYDFPNTSWASSAKATVYATWRDSSSFTVNFETGTEVEIPSQTVAKGGKATKPADPTREGRTFGGWYKGLDAYDFGAAVSSDLSLGALWLDGTKRTEQDSVPKEGEKTITEEGELPGGEKVTEIHIVTIPDNIPVSDEVIVERTTPSTKKDTKTEYEDGEPASTTITTTTPAEAPKPGKQVVVVEKRDGKGELIETETTETDFDDDGKPTKSRVVVTDKVGDVVSITETEFENGKQKHAESTEFTPHQTDPDHPADCTVKKTERNADNNAEKVTETDYDGTAPGKSRETAFDPAQADPDKPKGGKATTTEKDASGNTEKVTEQQYDSEGGTGKIIEIDYDNGEPAGTAETVFTPAQADPSKPAGGTVKKTEKDKDGKIEKIGERSYDNDGNTEKVAEESYVDGAKIGTTETTFNPARQDPSAPVEGTATKVEKDAGGNERKVTEDTYGPGGVQTGETVTEKETDGKTGKITETDYDNGEPTGTVETEFTPAQADPSNPAGTKVTKTEKDASGKVKEVTEADFDNGGETSGLTRKHYGEDGSLTGTDKVGFTPAQKDPERPAGCVASEVSLDGKGEKSEEKKTTYGDDGSVVGVVRLEYSPAIGENEKVPKPGQVTETTTDDIGDAVKTVTDYGDDGKPTDSVTYEPAEAPRSGVQKRSETTYDYSKSPAVKTTVEYEDSYVDGERASEPQRKSTAVYAPATLEFPASTQQTQNVVREEYGKDGATVAVHAETEVTYDTDGKVIRTRTIGQVTGSEIYTVTVVEPAYSGDALVSDTTTVTTMRRKGDVPDTANDESIERAITLANPASSSQVKSGERVSQTQKQAFNKEVGDFVAGGYSETTETFNERKRLENSVTVDYDGVDSSDKGREIAKSTTTYAYDGNGTVLAGSKTAAEQYDYASGEKRDSKLTSTERDGYGNVTSATVTDLKDYYNAANTDASKATVTETSYQYSDAGEDATISQSTVAEHVVTPANVSDACVQKTSTTVTRRDGAGAVLSTSQRETSVVYSKALDGLHAESVTQEFSPLDGNAGTQAVKLSGTALDSAGAANGGAWLALDVREEAASEQSEPVADAKAAYMRDGALRIGVESLRAYEVSLTRMSKDEAAIEQVSEGLDGLSVTLGVGETSKAVADVLHVHGRSELANEFRGVAVAEGAVEVGGEPAKGVTVQVDKLSEFLVALGAPDDVAITFKANGGAGADVVQVAAKGNVALQRNAFTRSGYSFAGWATSASGAVAYADGQTIAASSDLTLYAVWKGGASKPSPGAAKSPDQLVAADVADAIAKFTDADPAGSEFGLLQLKVSKAKKSSLKLTWKKQKGATRYVVLGSLCGKKYQQLTTTTGKTFTQKKLKKGKSYKYIVLAYDAAGKRVGVSKTVHAYTAGSKFGNVKKVTFKKKLTLKLKKSKKVKGKAVKMAGKKLKQHRKVMYESSNPKVATVNAKNGKVKAVGKGKCVIYAYACDGKMAKCKVTVK